MEITKEQKGFIETPRETSIRFLEWVIANYGHTISPSENYNIRRFIDIMNNDLR